MDNLFGDYDIDFVSKLKAMTEAGKLKWYRNSKGAVVNVFCLWDTDIIKFEVFYDKNIVDQNIHNAKVIYGNFRNVPFMWLNGQGAFPELIELLSLSEFDIKKIDEIQHSLKGTLVNEIFE